jgi:uncharacterized protein (DUF1800 family)
MTMRTSLVRIMRWPRLAAVALALLFGTPATAQQVFRDGFEPTVPAFPQNDAEAARFLTQATFGPTLTDIARLRQIGYAAWLDEQFALPPSHQVPYLDMVRAIPEPVYSNARMEAWWLNAVRGPDQLRQRIAYALSQIFVISDASDVIGAPYPVAHYYDLLIDNAFVPYRELLERVTTSPAMGAYLSMLGNRRPDVANNIRPDENYAREILQLFSIGLVQLNPDGSRVLQGGQPVPAYDQFHIKTFAHVFTGWNFGNCDGFEFCYPGYPEAVGWTMPMQPFAAFHHTEIDADPDNDSFLGGQLRPPGGTPQQNLELALDNIAAHPNVGPFIARRLIQNLVTSNPSPQYLARMSAVFANNGQGVRGDLRALVRAILLDPEARNGPALFPTTFGKVREPLLRQTHFWRAFAADSVDDRLRDWNPEFDYGQAPNRARSVFNFYLPDYQPPGELAQAGLYAPEIQIINETLVTSTANWFWFASERAHVGSPFADPDSIYSILVDFRPLQAIATSNGALLDRLDLLLMNGQMTPAMRAILLAHLDAIPYTAANDAGGRARAWGAVHLIMTSPEYIVHK